MPRYYDMEKIKNMIEAKAGTLIEGKEAFLYVAKWLELLPAADVVPRDEVAKIFEEIESVLFTVANPCPSADGTIIVKHSKDFHIRREDYYTIKEKYTKGGEQK